MVNALAPARIGTAGTRAEAVRPCHDEVVSGGRNIPLRPPYTNTSDSPSLTNGGVVDPLHYLRTDRDPFYNPVQLACGGVW